MLQFNSLVAGIKQRIRATPLARRIILLTIVLLAAVYASSLLILAHYYDALAERERDGRAAKAQLLAEHAGRAMAAVDLSLETIAEALKSQLPLRRPTVFTQVLLDKYIKNLPQARALVVADADGRTVNNSRLFPPPDVGVADRPYFSEQKKWRGAGLYLDRIAASRIDGKPFFAMSRPILDGDGNFHGIVAAITDPQYFANFYDPSVGKTNETVLLEREDGTVLASAGISDEAVTRPAREPERRRTAIAEVHGFPARIVLVGKPIIALPQFVTFLATDLGLLTVMTAMGLYLAATAAREAAAVDREAQARRTAEARLLSAIESAPAGFALSDRDNRQVLANDLYRAFFSRGGGPARPGSGLTASDSGDDAEPMLQLEDGRWLLARERRTKEGDTVVFYSDITSIKQHQEELERLNEAQRLFVDALEHIPSSLMLCDADDRLVFCNSATRRYFPKVAEMLVPGTPFEALVRAQVASMFLPAAAADPEAWIAERMAQHRAGTTNAVRAYKDGGWAQIIERRTESGCTIGVRTDITEIKQKEEALRVSEEAERTARRAAEEANRAKTAFLASMSHELRTPLNAIIGFSEMIALEVLGKLPDTYRHYGELVCTSGRHLLSIINDILDIAKLNSGKTELHRAPVDVGKIIAEAVSIISDKAAAARVRIAVEIDSRCPTIEADPVRLRQVLLNLLGNAVKFTPAGGDIEVSTAVVAGELRVTVKDTGIGMQAEDIPRAMEPFTQVGKSEVAAQDGTGLGLPISKALVVLHGGRFDIASAPGLGTTATITLPFGREDRRTADEPALDITASGRNWRRSRTGGRHSAGRCR